VSEPTVRYVMICDAEDIDDAIGAAKEDSPDCDIEHVGACYITKGPDAGCVLLSIRMMERDPGEPFEPPAPPKPLLN
jgi:hypothetical protein